MEEVSTILAAYATPSPVCRRPNAGELREVFAVAEWREAMIRQETNDTAAARASIDAANRVRCPYCIGGSGTFYIRTVEQTGEIIYGGTRDICDYCGGTGWLRRLEAASRRTGEQP
jgi:hypothetical protein